MMAVKFMGLYSLEVLPCGCSLKRYISGLNVIDEPKCKAHVGFKEYQCRSCNKQFPTKNDLKAHRWSHAI